MIKKLITLTPEERQHWKEQLMDPQGDRVAEDRINREARNHIKTLAFTIQIALNNPDDEDCNSLLAAIAKVMTGE